MCQAKDRFIFCSCSDKNKNVKKDKRTRYYSWMLTRYLGSKKARIRGKIALPTKDLGNGVTTNAILHQLNTDTNSFDFNYTPSHRDCLEIRILDSIPQYQYFKFIFIDGKWKEGSNYLFTSITEKIASGRIKKQTEKRQYISERNSWLEVALNDFDAIFSKNSTTRNSRQVLKTMRNYVSREPHLFAPKATKLIISDAPKDRFTGSLMLIVLYHSGFKVQNVKSILFDALQTEDQEEIISLIISAFGIDSKGLSEKYIDLICSFKNRNSDVKYSIMDTLDELKHMQVVDTFIEFSSDTDSEIRKTALSNLRSIMDVTNSHKIKEAFWKCIEDSNKNVRLEAILGLAELKDGHIKNIILQELSLIDKKSTLILDAIEALEDPSLIPHLEVQIEKHRSDQSYVYKWLVETLEGLQALQ